MWAIIGSYQEGETPGGLTVFRFDEGTGTLAQVGQGDQDLQAGYVVFDDLTDTVYSVDERKTDGRGPVGPAAAVHAFAFDRQTGELNWKDWQATPGAFPTFLELDSAHRALISASHGSFDHVEKVVQAQDGAWTVDYVYDDSTVVLHRLAADGGFAGIGDVQVLDGHGLDPNSSPQAGGHAQSGPHAHCATLDPTGQFLIVCDKGNDAILVFRTGGTLTLARQMKFPPETAPRHVAFTKDGTRLFATLELSSELASLTFDPKTGHLDLVDQISSVGEAHDGLNEPAELRLHPNEATVYVNNRGEDSLAWFRVSKDGKLCREGSVAVSASVHPGLAARSFAVHPDGQFLLFADRPANLVRIFALDPTSDAPKQISEAGIQAPAFVALIPEADGFSQGPAQ